MNHLESALKNPTLLDPSQYINPYAKGQGIHIPEQKTVKLENYKTVMCQSFLESMKCSYGDNCKFAHGEHELRASKAPPIVNQLKYKTKLCEKYTKGGICPYGIRCLFIHPDPPMNPHLPQKAAAPSNDNMTNSLHSIWSVPNTPQPQLQIHSCGCHIIVGCSVHNKTVGLFDRPSDSSAHQRLPTYPTVGCSTYRGVSSGGSNLFESTVESLYQRETDVQKSMNDKIIGSGQKHLIG